MEQRLHAVTQSRAAAATIVKQLSRLTVAYARQISYTDVQHRGILIIMSPIDLYRLRGLAGKRETVLARAMLGFF